MKTLPFVVCLVALAAPMAGQSAAPSSQARPQFRAGVDLMRIEVTVLDKRTRKPVRGLTAADFTVTVSGDPQQVEALDEVIVPGREAHRSTPFLEAARDVDTNTLAHPRLFLIVMDDALVSREGFAKQKGKDIAHAVVDALGPTDLAAIVFAQDNRQAQDFTADRAILRRAIDTHRPQAVAPMLAVAMSVGVIERSSAFLRRMPDYRRAIVWVTLGPGSVDLEDESLVTWELPPPQAINVTGGEAQEALVRATNRVVSAGRMGPVPVYAYSTVGLRAVTVNEIRGGPLPNPFGNEALQKVTGATGGRLIDRTNAPDLAVPAMFGELSSYYALAFRGNFPMDGKLRWLQVRVNRADVVVSPPDAAFATPKDMADARAASRVAKPAGLIEALAGPLPRGDVRLALGNVAVAVPGKKEQAVTLTLGIPAPPVGAERRQFAMSLFVYDSEGLRELITRRQTVSAPPRRTETDRLAEVAIPLSLQPGRYQLRVAVSEAATGASGSVYSTLTVPDFAKERLSMSGVAIGWAEGSPIGDRDTVLPLLPFAPTVVREFASTDRVGALVRVHQGTGRAVPVQLQTQILDAGGAVVASGTTQLAAPDFADGHGAEHRYELPLRLLQPGAYLLRFVAVGAERTVTRDVRFSVR